MSISYPVAPTVDEALSAPKGLAAREREAVALAGQAVEFVAEAVGPEFTTEAALIDTYPAAAAQPWASIRPVSAQAKTREPVVPSNQDGKRWPTPKNPAAPLWRLSISYWRITGSDQPPAEHARRLRRSPEAEDLDPKTLRALARQPLRPVLPQQPLDIGLFEIRPPDAPHIIMPDD